MGHPFAIAIVDDSGVLKAFSRMDGAALEAVVGGIGVSGGHYSQDMEVAQAGLSAHPSS